jgi:hypothetical protein
MPFKAYLWKLSVFLSTGKIFDLTFIHTPASREVELGRIIVGWFPVKNWQTTIKTISQDWGTSKYTQLCGSHRYNDHINLILPVFLR